MKRNFYITALIATVATLCSGCKVNNGDIGLLYGVWFVSSVEVDGAPYTDYRADGSDSFFQFQNNIINIARTDAYHSVENRYGTWEWIKEDTEIALNFTHHDNAHPTPGEYMYGPPEWLLLTVPAVYNFDVSWTDDKHCVWSTVNTEGRQLKYYLRKTY